MPLGSIFYVMQMKCIVLIVLLETFFTVYNLKPMVTIVHISMTIVHVNVKAHYT